jgi:spore germination protein YaaH
MRTDVRSPSEGRWNAPSGRRPLLLALLSSLLAVSFAAGCATSAGPRRSVTPPTKGDFFVAGYHPYWAASGWTAYPFDLLDELFFFEAEAGAEGTLADLHGWPTEWAGMADAAMRAGVQVVPTVSMHDPDAFETVFTDAARIDRLVESSLSLLAARPTLAGIHLDFEVFQPVSLEARDGFTAFVALLAERLRARYPGKSLSSFALAFDDDNVYNEGAIGAVVDYLVVQGYDYHSAGSEQAGPLGATRGWGRLNWDFVVQRFDALGVPRNKLVMGVPLYGYEWPVASGEMGAPTRGMARTLPYTAPPDVRREAPRAKERAAEAGPRRDPESGVPWYALESEDGWIQGWYDDPESLRLKYEFVRSRGLGGIAIFPAAYADREIWDGIRDVFRGPN